MTESSQPRRVEIHPGALEAATQAHQQAVRAFSVVQKSIRYSSRVPDNFPSQVLAAKSIYAINTSYSA